VAKNVSLHSVRVLDCNSRTQASIIVQVSCGKACNLLTADKVQIALAVKLCTKEFLHEHEPSLDKLMT